MGRREGHAVMEPVYVYAATVTKVVDGDTLRLQADLGFKTHVDLTVRVKDLWAPELDTPGGHTARQMAELLIPPGTRVVIRTHKTRTGNDLESLGRYVADVQLADGRDFAEVMVSGGFGTAAKAG